MALVDEITVSAVAGTGGTGVTHWLRTKSNARGGPDGGDGGKGGDIVLVGVRDLSALARYRYEKTFRAADGAAGQGRLRSGADGPDTVLTVPVGTLVRFAADAREYEIMREGERIVVFKGGHGGRGNARFKSSTNQNPFTHTDGKSGESGDITFTLKLIADAGLIGLPNAGKSSLLNALTSARSKVGEYPFTTLEPSLGDFYGYLIADIPGLISGASSGRGLGTRFLKHIERTGFTIHLISAEQAEPVHAYDEVRNELEAFGHGLSTKHELVVVSKADLVPDALLANTVRKLEQHTGREVLAVSVKNATLVKRLADRLTVLLSDQSA